MSAAARPVDDAGHAAEHEGRQHAGERNSIGVVRRIEPAPQGGDTGRRWKTRTGTEIRIVVMLNGMARFGSMPLMNMVVGPDDEAQQLRPRSSNRRSSR